MSTSADTDPLIDLLTELRDNQRQQLALQNEAMEMQREQFRLFKAQADHASKLQARAEGVQEMAAVMMEKARKLLTVVLPLLLLLVGYLFWLMLK